MPRDVWTLDVFRRAYELSIDVHRVSLSFPKIEQYVGIANQVRRASKSICALLAEGSGRQLGSEAEFRRYVLMALGSSDEAKLWCSYVRDLGYAEVAVAERWIQEFSEIARMLQGLIKHLSLMTDD
jgi:four helix bundle protein